MIYVTSDSTKPQFNLALEEYVFEYLDEYDEIFMLWQNEPSIIVGKHQNTIEEINTKYVKENNIHVVRRLSGGGAVYHDLGNLNYTIISKVEGSNTFDFKTFSQPVIDVLADLGIKAEFTGRNDIVIGGQKFCGNAQYMKKGKVLHHGAILFDTELNILGKSLKVSKDKIISKGVKSVRSRVTNIKDHLKKEITVEDFKNLLLKRMFGGDKEILPYELSEEDLKNINELVEKRYGTWEWNYGESPEFNIRKSNRFQSGKVETLIDVDRGVIKELKFYGDFFGHGDLENVENKLIGIKYNENDIKDVLKDVDIDYYFSGISMEELLSCIID
ncbi:lipoate--protein ligase [Anaerosalibacter massiliensis]|uniref:lipoate--protein ligase n=1 Tax=Anaerosalibacter massiliensis TaxID=1347392 RepID=A0A9X2MJX0_9FIRM|nr:lipoate--protein ligase [Anaerosalibacter massiliensis]MCR2045410.1 lipoate--protein ligase [Anaerosalibacter massiliensis]